jgi:hypothetical protein
MKPNEEIIGTLLVSLLVFGTQNRAKWLSAEELTHRAIESSILATDPTLIHYRKVLQSMSAYYRIAKRRRNGSTCRLHDWLLRARAAN